MSARDEAGEALSDIELRDELMTLLIAGHETTATALAWALYWIHRLPLVRQRLLHELGSHPTSPARERLHRRPTGERCLICFAIGLLLPGWF
jgi:cytochrome P450